MILQDDKEIKEFLEMLAIPKFKKHISSKIKTEDFQNYWKKANKKTSLSISGLHCGHYKSAAENKSISKLHAMFLDTTIKTGTIIERWTKGLSVMLEKLKGNINVEKLRGVLLMEADYNFLSKLLLGVRLMRSVEARQGFPEELAGSRKRHEAIDVALNRKLVSDMMRQLKRPGTITGVDAASCYDRIVHSIVILIARHEGLSLLPLLSLFGVIQQMKYFVRTGYGESTSFYGGKRITPYQGTCQGNGASPTYWLIITMIMVLLMHKKGHALELKFPLTKEELHCMGFIFVDDTDLIVIAKENETVQDVMRRQQQGTLC